MKKKKQPFIKQLQFSHIFNNIKDANGNIVGIVKNHQMLTSSDSFINAITTSDINNFANTSNFKNNKIIYNVIDTRSDKIVAQIDNKYNVFNMEGLYTGTIKSSKRSIITFYVTLIVTLIGIILTLLSLRQTVDLKIDSVIRIIEMDGDEIVENWNILGENKKDKVLYPGRKYTYRFTVINDNDNAVEFTLNFEDINDDEIPMMYRLSSYGGYIHGNDDTWVKAEDIELYKVIIPAHSEITYALHWMWITETDEKDTMIGNNNANYIIRVFYQSTVYDQEVDE